jgi:hypothetical protein
MSLYGRSRLKTNKQKSPHTHTHTLTSEFILYAGEITDHYQIEIGKKRGGMAQAKFKLQCQLSKS